MSHLKGFPDLPPIWWLCAMALIWLADSWLPSAASVGLERAGGLLMALGIALVLWSALWFLRKRTPIEPHHTPKALIIEGPYRLCRNPIYLSLVAIALAAAIGRGSVPGVVVAAGLWFVLDRRFAAVEEALLLSTFGAEAEAYLQQTRRWL